MSDTKQTLSSAMHTARVATVAKLTKMLTDSTTKSFEIFQGSRGYRAKGDIYKGVWITIARDSKVITKRWGWAISYYSEQTLQDMIDFIEQDDE